MNVMDLIVYVYIYIYTYIQQRIQKEAGLPIKLYHVFVADLHWQRAGVSEPLQKVGSLLRRTGEGLLL